MAVKYYVLRIEDLMKGYYCLLAVTEQGLHTKECMDQQEHRVLATVTVGE